MKNQPQGQVLTRDAGIALDALIDEAVFGYEWFEVSPADIAPPTCTHRLARPAGDGYYGHIRAERHADGRVAYLGGNEYSTNIAVAWLVVEKLRTLGYEVIVSCPPAPTDSTSCEVAQLRDQGSDVEYAATAPLAICRAALAVVGGSDA